MIRTLARPLALAALLATALPALASGPSVPEATQSAVREKLVAEGYEVRSIQMEDGRIEVYAMKEGRKHEVYLDAQLNIVEVKNED